MISCQMEGIIGFADMVVHLLLTHGLLFLIHWLLSFWALLFTDHELVGAEFGLVSKLLGPLIFSLSVISVTDPLSLISVYSHLSQPYSRCYLGHRSNTTIGSPFSTYRRHRCVTRSDPLIYHPDEDDEKLMEVNTADDGDNDASCETSEESDDMEALGLCSPDGAFGLSGTADRTMCLLVGLLRGVLFWRCCSSREDEGSATPIAGPSTSGMVVARDRFGCEAARSDGLGLRDDQISLLVRKGIQII